MVTGGNEQLMNLNNVYLTGNLTRDAEERVTQGGLAIVRFTVAHNKNRKNDNGEWESTPHYFDCVMFGANAERYLPQLVKGAHVIVTGELRQSTWEKDGQKRSKVEIAVNGIDTIEKARQAVRGDSSGLYDESIPF